MSDVEPAGTTYAALNAAWDFDTDQTYQISPERALWIAQHLGFTGDLDFYAGVFFALKRVRSGGSFHAVTITLGGTFSTGTGFGDGDVIWFTIGGTVTPYLANCFVQALGILSGQGLVPWGQFGEISHWYFSETMNVPIVGMTNSGGSIEFETSEAHGLTSGQTAIVAGAPFGNGTATVTVIDSTHFTNGTSWPGGR